MNFLIIGGCGYIGSRITQELVQKGHKVLVFDNACAGSSKGGFGSTTTDMAAQTIQLINFIFEDQPFHLAGISMGGKVRHNSMHFFFFESKIKYLIIWYC